MQLAAADPTVLNTASDIITAAKTSALKGGFTALASLNVQHLAADPAVLAACVPFIEAAANVSGPYWTAVVPQLTAVPKVNPSATHCCRVVVVTPDMASSLW